MRTSWVTGEITPWPAETGAGHRLRGRPRLVFPRLILIDAVVTVGEVVRARPTRGHGCCSEHFIVPVTAALAWRTLRLDRRDEQGAGAPRDLTAAAR